MMDRKLQKELAEILESVEGIFDRLDWSDSQQVQDVLEILGAVDGKCKENLSKEAYAKYNEIFSGLAEIVQDTDWKRLSTAEQTESCDLCREIMGHVVKMLKTEKEVKKIIVFLPYKASMWDSLESVWRATHEDKEHCEAYVVPIPYADRNPDGSVKEWHCEMGMFPEDVPVLDYREYSISKLQEMQPDAIFIHNPYDGGNLVTSVEASYYSDKLKKCTKNLMYVPYYATSGGMAEFQELMDSYHAIDRIFVQSKAIAKLFHESIQSKVVPLGSPKFDRAIRMSKNPPAPPEIWRNKLKGKKAIFYNTSIGGALSNINEFFSKLEYVINICSKRSDICLIWRPHPLLYTTLQSMRPEYVKRYEKIRDCFIRENIGIYDDTPDIDSTIAISDAYIGDAGTSVTSLFGVAGKPVFILNNKIHSLPKENDWLADIMINKQWQGDDEWMVMYGNCLFRKIGNAYKFVQQLSKYRGSNDYYRTVSYKDKLYICPTETQDILVYQEGLPLRKIQLKEETSRNACFGRSWQVGNKLVLLPVRYPHLVVLDLETEKVTYINDIQKVISKQINGEWFFGGSCVCQDTLIVSGTNCGEIFVIDPAQMTVEQIAMDPACHFGYSRMQSYGDELWMIPYLQEESVAVYHMKTKKIRLYSSKGIQGLRTIHPWCGYETNINAFGGIAVSETEVFLPALWGNKFVKLDRESGEFREWKVPFDLTSKEIDCYFDLGQYGEFIKRTGENKWVFWYIPERQHYIYDTETDAWEKLDDGISKENFREILRGFSPMAAWLRYACNEDGVNSLKDFLDGNIKGTQFDLRKQLEAYGEIAENMDGSAGEKIYEYTIRLCSGEGRP